MKRASLAFCSAVALLSGNSLAQEAPPAEPAPSTPPAAPSSSPYDIQAGGLAPPPPTSDAANNAAAPKASDEKKGEDGDKDKEKEKKDSGRGLEFVYLDTEGGFEQLGLQTFNVDESNFTAGFVSTSATGGYIGAGAGLRLLFLTLGARARMGFFSNYQLYSLGGELGLHVPLGSFEPRFDLGFGYVGLGNFQSDVSGASDALQIHGFYARVRGGFDYYLVKYVSLGATIGWELLGLTRPGVSLDQISKIKMDASTNPAAANADLLAANGTSYGSALTIGANLGLHF